MDGLDKGCNCLCPLSYYPTDYIPDTDWTPRNSKTYGTILPHPTPIQIELERKRTYLHPEVLLVSPSVRWHLLGWPTPKKRVLSHKNFTPPSLLLPTTSSLTLRRNRWTCSPPLSNVSLVVLPVLPWQVVKSGRSRFLTLSMDVRRRLSRLRRSSVSLLDTNGTL